MDGGTKPFVNGRLTRALAHPTRSAILELLIGEEGLAPSTISGKLGVKAANTCYHVDVLLACGAVEVRPGEKRRGERLIRLPQPTREPGEGKKNWLDVAGSMRDDVSEAQLRNLIEIASDFPPGYASGSSS